MGKLINIEEYVVNKTSNRFYRILSEFSDFYMVDIDFTKKEFIHFNYLLYSLYCLKEEKYKYSDDMEIYIYTTLLKSIRTNKSNIKIVDVIDGVFDVKVNNIRKSYIKKR